MGMTVALGFSFAILCAPAPGHADTLNLGVLSFDVLVPGAPDAPGVNVFDIANLTGDTSGGGFALPPDFPALTFLTFLNSSITLTFSDSSQQVIFLGDIDPGFFSSGSPLQFPDTTLFTSAVFAATLNSTTTLLDGGSSFAADPTVRAFLSPASGASLVAGSDFALIEGMSPTSLPEPGTGGLLAAALGGLVWIRRQSKQINH